MQRLQSDYRELCGVMLPYEGRQMYMRTFDVAAPQMPEGFEDYLSPALTLCWAAGLTKGLVHMTVDEKVVRAGQSQRKPEPHVDGCFIPERMDWGHGGGGWNHYCNNVPIKSIERMPVIVASSAVGCRAWKGKFDAIVGPDGSLPYLEPNLGAGVLLPVNIGYLLSADCIHESVKMAKDTPRTFLRLALPVDFKF